MGGCDSQSLEPATALHLQAWKLPPPHTSPSRGSCKTKAPQPPQRLPPPSSLEGRSSRCQKRRPRGGMNPASWRRTTKRTDYDFVEMNKLSSPQLNSQDDGEDTVTDFDAQEAVTSDILAEELAAPRRLETKCLPRELASEGLHCSKVFLDREERQRQFTLKRKRHCDEGLAMKLARLDLEESESEGMQEENEESLCAANERTSTEESQ